MDQKRCFFFILFVVTMQVEAQCKSCSQDDNDWRFAAGVTLYNNTYYNSSYIDQSYRPLEFNLRYKFAKNHMIRMSLPIVIKENLHGSKLYHPSYDGSVSLEDFYKLMSAQDAVEYFQMLEFNYSLYGTSLGYDYNYTITPAFSAFAGVDFAYYYTLRNFNFYGAAYLKPIDYTSKIFCMEDVQVKDHIYEYAIKPVTGIRYQYQKLLFEVSFGFSFFNYKYNVIKKTNTFYPDGNISTQLNENLTQPFFGIQKQFIYQLSVYYIF